MGKADKTPSDAIVCIKMQSVTSGQLVGNSYMNFSFLFSFSSLMCMFHIRNFFLEKTVMFFCLQNYVLMAVLDKISLEI